MPDTLCAQWFRMPGMFRLAMGGLLLSNVFFNAAPSMAEDGKIIAVYGDAVALTNPPAGWSFLWNAHGTMGDSKSYEPLVAVKVAAGQRQILKYVVLDEAGALRPDRPSHSEYGDTSSVRDKDGTARYAIASYTLQEEPMGEIWINNGNLRGGGTLEIYLNDERRFNVPVKWVKGDRIPFLFQQRLGKLKKGDSIRVAVGHGGGRLRFTVEEYPAGQKPGEPVNILSPALTAAEPQRGADGRYAKYLNMHKAQCEEVLANKPELVFIGDSITVRWPAELLKAKYGKYRPVKLGIGGDWIQNVLWRVLNGVLGQVPIKVVVVLIGTNNLANGFTPEEVAEGIGLLIKALHEKTPGSKILLLGILPRGDSIRDPINDKVRQVNARLALMADSKIVFFLDVGDKLVEQDGTISKEVMPDKLHVAMPGYIRWLDAMSPTLDKLLNNP